MTTLTKYQVEHQDGSKLGQKHGSLVDAVLEAAGHDGFHARFERMDDEGNIAPTNAMRLFSGSKHIGNNPYVPDPRDAFGFESALLDDEAAMAEVAQKVYMSGVYHSRYKLDIVELTYADGVLMQVGKQSVERLAEDADSSVEAVRKYWDED